MDCSYLADCSFAGVDFQAADNSNSISFASSIHFKFSTVSSGSLASLYSRSFLQFVHLYCFLNTYSITVLKVSQIIFHPVKCILILLVPSFIFTFYVACSLIFFMGQYNDRMLMRVAFSHISAVFALTRQLVLELLL